MYFSKRTSPTSGVSKAMIHLQHKTISERIYWPAHNFLRVYYFRLCPLLIVPKHVLTKLMPIRRKDGSIFKLRGPNKIMITQKFWDDEERTVVHNFHDLSKVTLEEENLDRPQIELPPEPAIEIMLPVEVDTEVYIEKAELPEKIEVTEIKEVKPSPPEPPPAPAENLSRHRQADITEFFCLPAKAKRLVDELYDEDVLTVSYGDPFKFQATIPHYSDHKIVIWTTVDKVTDRSVIFHRANRRWWRIELINPDPSGDGLLMACNPSDLKPDFSAVAAPISS